MQWEVELQWTAAPAAARYDLWVWWDEETGWQRLDDGNLTGIAYTHTDVTAGRTYYYTVRAVGANGETGPFSPHAPVTVPAPTTTPTPTSIPVGPGPAPTATPTATTTATPTPAAGGAQGDLAAPALTARATVNTVAMQWEVELKWTESPAAVRYELWVWWNEETGWQRLDDGNLAGIAYTHTDVTAGRTYYYTVRAVGANGEAGPFSTHAPVTVPAPTTTPTPTSIPVGPSPAPTATPTATTTPTATPTAGGAQGDLAAPALTATATVNAVAMQWEVELQWTAAPAAVRYELWVWWDEETGWQRLDDGNLAGIAYTHTDVTAGRTYYYTVRAVGANGEAGPYSAHAYVTVSALTAPALQAETGAGYVTLTWAAVPAAVRYELWVWRDEETGWQRIDDGNLAGVSYTHTDVAAGRTYYYAIRAVGANGETGPWSQWAQAAVPASATRSDEAAPVAL